jgi:hypothetical protein
MPRTTLDIDAPFLKDFRKFDFLDVADPFA